MRSFKQVAKKILLCWLSASLVAGPAGASLPLSTYLYGPHGNVASARAGAEPAVSYAYDSQGYLASENWPGAAPGVESVAYGYDAQRRLSLVRDARGLGTLMGRSGDGALTRYESPDSGVQLSTYDEAGNLTRRTTATGAVLQYAYDAANRLTQVDSGDDVTRLQYDTALNGAGRLATVSNASGWSGWDYDAQGNIASRTQVVSGGASLGLRYTYSNGRLSSLRYPSGKTVSFTYDAERITAIAVDGAAVITDIKYFAQGIPSSWRMGDAANGAAAAGNYQRTFDTAGRIVSHTHEAGTRTLTWDAASRLTAVQEPDGSVSSYGHDGLGRLLSAAEQGQSLSYSFDLGGNRTSQSGQAPQAYSVDPGSNRLSTVSGSSGRAYSYDAAGHTVSDGTRTFEWDSQGQLARVTTPAGTSTYSYNGLGQRVKKTTPAATRYYVYADDGLSLLGEYWQAGEGTPLGVKNEIVYLEGVPVLLLRPNGVFYVQVDHLNTPRTVKDTNGTVVWRWVSDPYGQAAADQNPGGVFYFEFNSRLPGQQFDSETGLHYNNARYYDPSTGRYLSSDPIGLAGGLNTYAYGGNGPTYAGDPSGHLIWFAFQAAFYLWTAYDAYRFGEEHIFGPCAQANRGTIGRDAGLLLAGMVPVGRVSKVAKVADVVRVESVAAKGATTPIWSATKSKSAVENALGHWNKHKAEFPELANAKQYAKTAGSLVTSPPAGALTKARGAETLIYDQATNTFLVRGANGAPKTMFRPTDGLDYWNKQ